MLAISPPLFFTSYGWPLEDPNITQNLQHDYNEANSYNPLLDLHNNIPTYDQIQHDFIPQISISSGGVANGAIDDTIKVAKKLNHNASERDRRKRVNNLYAFLRSLLPISSDQKKKVSIPCIVSRAVKYIPELRKEVETLKIEKEKLSVCSSSTDIRNRDVKIQRIQSVVASVSVLDEKEVVIQLIFDHMNKNKDIGLLSKALEYLEGEENGLVLIDATTFKCLGEKRFSNTLHFQVQGDHKIDAEKLEEKLCFLYQ